MKLKRHLPRVGLGILALVFVGCLARVLFRPARASGARTTLRLAHYHLDANAKTAFSTLARDYEKLHPEIGIEIMDVPGRIWAQWQRTQLTAGLAPDIVELGFGETDEMLARYFLPLTSLAERPNPYNASTARTASRWRDTIVGGLTDSTSFNRNLGEVFSVPLAMFTIRICYNRDLMRSITGTDLPPRTYAEFVRLCQATDRYAAANQTPVRPLAGSKFNTPSLISLLAGHQTQRLALELDGYRTLRPLQRAVAGGYLRGDWSFETPAMRSAVELAAEFGGYMPVGSMTLDRANASTAFAQGRVLMISTDTQDMPSLARSSPFRVGVFALPLPGRDDPRYGAFVFGAGSEASNAPGCPLGVSRQSQHPETAIDFLRFLTSEESNRRFADITGWLPSVKGVAVPPAVAAFQPVEAGYVDGFNLYLQGLGGAVQVAYSQNIEKLLDPRRGVDAFLETFTPAFSRAVREDLGRMLRSDRQTLRRSDAIAGALMAMPNGRGTDDAEKLTATWAAQNANELQHYQTLATLRQTDRAPE